MSNTEVVIVDIKRTPIGSFGGSLSTLSAPELGGQVIKALLNNFSHPIDSVIMGQVLSAGCGQAPARQAAMKAGLGYETTCTTINKVCGSGLEAVIQATAMIQSNQAEIVIAGGMESMSNCPYYLDKARNGYRLGHADVIDSIIKDGLWDVYNDFHMGEAAELCAEKFNISREEQDEYAIRSYNRSLAAMEKGIFKNEIIPCTIKTRKGEEIIEHDEEPGHGNFEKIPKLRPAFKRDGTITAANASSLNDGASACILMSREKAEALKLKPKALIKSCNRVAQDPAWFSTSPIKGIRKLSEDNQFNLDDIDLFEINEAFSVVAIAAERELELNPNKVNVHGGAVSLGHPIGASGTRILCTLLHSLEHLDKSTGIASLCIGGGEACSLLVERLA